MTDHRTFYKGLYYEVQEDRDSLDPREGFDHLGTMVCWHDRTNLGDRTVSRHQDTYELLRAIYGEEIPFPVLSRLERLHDEGPLWKASFKIASYIASKVISLDVHLFEHSGMILSTTPFNDPWDSGQVGYIYVSREKARSEFGWSRLTKKRIAHIEAALAEEVAEYSAYLEGEVYGYIITNAEGEELDSCWGFIGDPNDHLIPTVKATIESLLTPKDNPSPTQLSLFEEALT